MLQTDLFMGRFEPVETFPCWDSGELLRAVDRDCGPALVYVPDTEERARRERERLQILECPGVPECHEPDDATAAGALIFPDLCDATPVLRRDDLPPPTIRAGLGRLLSVLSHAHGRCQAWFTAGC